MYHFVPDSPAGPYPGEQKPKAFLNDVDQWLSKHRDKERHIVFELKAVHLAAAAIQMASQKTGLHQVYGVSCGLLPEAAAKAEGEIQRILNAEQVEFLSADNILYDPDSMHLLNGAVHRAVMIEKARCIQYKESRRELELLRRQEIDVLGMVVVE